MWQSEGWTTFYRGYWPTILGVIPYAGVSFFTYDSLKHFYEGIWLFIISSSFNFINLNLKIHPFSILIVYIDHYGTKQPAIVKLLFGGIAGIAGQSSSYPLDIVR